MSYTYSTWVQAIANFLVVPNYASDTNFQNAVPVIIDDSEQRLYRELQLLNTVTRDSSAALSQNTPTFNLPSQNGTFVVTEVSARSAQQAPRIPTAERATISRQTKETINYLYPTRRDRAFRSSSAW